MPASKHRNRSQRKRHPVTTEKQKFENKVNAQLRQSYAFTPDNSIAVAIANQCEALREHLRDPKGFLGIVTAIQQNPKLDNFEQYCDILWQTGAMTRRRAYEFLYELKAFRAIESWKRVAQSYTISASLLDKILYSKQTITLNVADLILPFSTFFVDLGTLGPHDQHVGLFVDQRDQQRIDFVFIKGDRSCSLELNHHITIAPPADDHDWELSDIGFMNYLVTAVLQAISLRDRDPAIVCEDIGGESREHTEWLTRIGLADTPLHDPPHWLTSIDGKIHAWRCCAPYPGMPN